MVKLIGFLRHSLISRLVLIMGVILFISIALLAWINLNHQQTEHFHKAVRDVDRLSETIRLGTHYAMMLNSREDINQIIRNIGQQPEILQLRVYSKQGEIKYSVDPAEINHKRSIDNGACIGCHFKDPPLVKVALDARTRVHTSSEGNRTLALTSPIYNEPVCASADCHVHPAEKKVLGILDISVSMENTDEEMARIRKTLTVSTASIFLLSGIIIYISITWLVKRPVDKLINGTQQISEGNFKQEIKINRRNEFGRLAQTINNMGGEIGRQQALLNQERDKFENLFQLVPCLISVQDRQYRLTAYNQNFTNLFDPQPGDFCFSAYKGRTKKCENCPVEKTFRDGLSHFSEETGTNKDGSTSHWVVSTVPIRDENGEVVAAMEMSLDVTQMKQLQQMLLRTEKRYHTIFNNIPHPVFVIDKDSLFIKDCNNAAEALYGYRRSELCGKNFMDIFDENEREFWENEVRNNTVFYQVRNRNRSGGVLFVNIRISPIDAADSEVLLVTTSDITERIEVEQQLIQAGKMATLGEMATGVAHELNQPLSVIKTASSFFMRKITREEPIADDILLTMSREIDNHVDRATKIINHMREFGRKSNQTTEIVHVNEVIRKAFDIFSQQLKLRGIETVWALGEDLPAIRGNAFRLEQVFINLLINARDAIEDRTVQEALTDENKRITLRTGFHNQMIVAEVEDTGVGISVDIAEKIFEPFFTTKKVGKGTGLGLSISYGIIQDLGGSIRARQAKGPGTTIEIQIPTTDVNL